MILDAVQNALQRLKEERDRLDAAIGQLEGLTRGVGVGNARGRRGRRPGRRGRGRQAAAGATARRRRKNAPRGLLKQKIHEVLKSSKRPLAPVELRNRVIEVGYPVKNPKTLYTAIFAATKKDPRVKKTKQGFSFKAGR